jgi:3-hydroxyisobutyrate dehydrogenase-like beta-hydroxyacid dehydrogenase
MKLANNLLYAANLAVFGEALSLAERLGLDGQQVLAWLLGTPAVAPYVKSKVDFLRAGGSPPQFPIRLVEKDLRLMLEAGGGAPSLPVTAAARASYRAANEAGLGEEDFSHVITHHLGHRLNE